MGFFRQLFGGKEETPEEKAEKKRLHDFEVLKYDGLKALRMGKAEHAITLLQEALSLAPDMEALSYLVEAHTLCGHLDTAHNLLEAMVETEPENAHLWYAMACNEEARHDYKAMDEHCTKALELDPNNPKTLYRAARAKRQLKDAISSVALLTRAIMQDNSYTEAYLLRAEILREMGSLTEAEADADHLLEQGEDEDPLMLKATLRAQQGDLQGAADYFGRVVKLNPLHREAYIALSQTYALNHQLDRALTLINEAIELMPDFGEAYKERGRIKMLLNDKEGATDDLKKALANASEAAKGISGEFTNIEEATRQQYKNMNPYGF